MYVSATTQRALDEIATRAGDVRRAFTAGAIPVHDDVATAAPASRFSLDPMSVAAPGGDYFVTTDAQGRRAFTRDGSMNMRDGTIVGSNGRPLLALSNDGALVEMHVDAVDAALDRVKNLRTSSDGTVQYERSSVDPKTGARCTISVGVGRLALARFTAATKLGVNSDGTLSAPAGTSAHIGAAGDGNFGAITPMRREESRIDLDRSLEALHDAYVSFDAMQAAHKAQGAIGKLAMDLLK